MNALREAVIAHFHRIFAGHGNATDLHVPSKIISSPGKTTKVAMWQNTKDLWSSMGMPRTEGKSEKVESLGEFDVLSI
jgi:hypothetical protein